MARADQQPPPDQVPAPNQVPTTNPPNQVPPPDQTPTTTAPDQTPAPSPTTEPTPPPGDTSSTTTVITPGPTTTTVVTPTAPAADTDTETVPSMYGWNDDEMQTGIGVSTILGGGVSGFTDKTMRDTTSNIGGLWDLRVTIGSHIPLALDLSYIGTATDIRALPTGQSGTLIGTTAEAAVRYNILPHMPLNPYIFGGVGWQRYDVTQTHVTLSDSGMNNHDNLVEFPMGAGLGYRMNGFVLDVRGTFRATMDQNLVLKDPSLGALVVAPSSSDFAPMHTWEASAALGYEF